MPDSNPYTKYATESNPYAKYVEPPLHPASSEWDSSAPLPDVPKPAPTTFAERMKAWLGIPLATENPDKWAHKHVPQGGSAGREYTNAFFMGYAPDIDKATYSAIYGPKYGKAYEKAERDALATYRKENPKTAFTADLAGNVTSMLTGGRALGLAGKIPAVARAVGAARPAAQAIATGARVAAPLAGAAGAVAGGMHGEQVTGSTSAEGRLAGAGEGMVEGYRLAGHIPEAMVAAALGAMQGSGEAGPDHRTEGAIAGGAVGGATGLLLPAGLGLAKQAVGGLDVMTDHALTHSAQGVDAAVRKLFGMTETDPVSVPLRNAARRMAAAAQKGRKLPSGEEVAQINAARAARGQKPLTGMEVANQEQLLLTRSAGRRLAPERAKALREHIQTGLPTETGEMAGQVGASKPPVVREGRVPTVLRRAAQGVGSEQGRAEAAVLRENPHDILASQARAVAPHTDVSVNEHVADLEDMRGSNARSQYREPLAQPLAPQPALYDVLDMGRLPEVRKAVLGAEYAKAHALGDRESGQVLHEIDQLKKYYTDLDKWEKSAAPKSGVEGWDLSAVPEADRALIASRLRGEEPPGYSKRFRTYSSPEDKAAAEKTRLLNAERMAMIYGATKEGMPPLPPMPQMSAATVFAISKRLANAGSHNIEREGLRELGSNMVGLSAEMRNSLRDVPHLAEANAEYAGTSRRMEAAQQVISNFKKMPVREFENWVHEHTSPEWADQRSVGPEWSDKHTDDMHETMSIAAREMIERETGSPKQAETFYRKIYANTDHIRDRLTALMGPDATPLFATADRAHVLDQGVNRLLHDTPEQFRRWMTTLHPSAQGDMAQTIADHLTGHAGSDRDAVRLAEDLHVDPDLRDKIVAAVGKSRAQGLFDAAQRVDVLKTGETMLGKSSADFTRWFGTLTPEAKNDLKHVLQEALTPEGGFSKDSATDAARILTRVTRDPNIPSNIKILFADEPGKAEQLLDTARSLREKNTISVGLAGTGSGTSVDVEGANMINEISHIFSYKKAALSFLKEWVNEGNRVTPEEADALYDFMEGDAHALLNVIEKNPKGFLGQAVRVGMARAASGYTAQQITPPSEVPVQASEASQP